LGKLIPAEKPNEAAYGLWLAEPAFPVSGTVISSDRNSAPGPIASNAACTCGFPPSVKARPPSMN
jgi:hypothetical protein